MNQVNAAVNVNPLRLNQPMRTWYARQLHSFVVRVNDIPDDNTSVVCRVFAIGGASFVDVPVSRCGRETFGLCYIVGTVFPTAGNARYEIHAYDARGNMTALGVGEILIEAFSNSGAPIQPGVAVPLTQIRDANGNYHTISAVPDGLGNYTSVVDA